MVVDVFVAKVIDVDDDAMFVTSTTLPFALSFRAGSCGSTYVGVAFDITPFQVGPCVTTLLRGTCVGDDGHGLSIAFLSFRTHTMLVFLDVVGCALC